MRKVSQANFFPRLARRRGIEGIPIVSFALGHKGELAKSSGHEIMNDAALEAIRNGASYPHIPEPLNEKSITFKLSISYILSGP